MRRAIRAFTLLELLVVMAIIAVLVTFVAVSLRAVRLSAARTNSLGALRQMAVGYAGYCADYRQRLLPGYIEADLFEPGEAFEDLRVRAPDGRPVDPEAAQSYVWRLAPYVDGSWQTFFADLNDRGLVTALESEYGAGVYGPGSSIIPGGISERPSFGLNVRFVGRYYSKRTDDILDKSVWNTRSYKAKAVSEVKTPATVILFAPAARAHLEGSETIVYRRGGFHRLSPPYTCGGYGSYQDYRGYIWAPPYWIWTTGPQGQAELVGRTFSHAPQDEQYYGLPFDRRGKDRVPVVHLDASTSLDRIAELARDMRNWAPLEVTQSLTLER